MKLTSSASAQARSPRQVVLSPSVSKSLTANRQKKSKNPLTARVGVRHAPASTVVTSRSAHSAPTSVRVIRKTIPAAR